MVQEKVGQTAGCCQVAQMPARGRGCTAPCQSTPILKDVFTWEEENVTTVSSKRGREGRWWERQKKNKVFWQERGADAAASARLAEEGRLSGRWQGQPDE